MTRGLPLRRSIAAVLLATLLTAEANAAQAVLRTGDAFPGLEASPLAGADVRLPDERRGTPFVLVFGFSRSGGDAAMRWSTALAAELPPAETVYAVADLSGIPAVVRGFAVAGIHRQARALDTEHGAHLLLLTHPNAWARLAPAGSDEDAVVVAVGADGTVTEIERRPFSDAAARSLAQRIAAEP